MKSRKGRRGLKDGGDGKAYVVKTESGVRKVGNVRMKEAEGKIREGVG